MRRIAKEKRWNKSTIFISKEKWQRIKNIYARRFSHSRANKSKSASRVVFPRMYHGMKMKEKCIEQAGMGKARRARDLRILPSRSTGDSHPPAGRGRRTTSAGNDDVPVSTLGPRNEGPTTRWRSVQRVSAAREYCL